MTGGLQPVLVKTNRIDDTKYNIQCSQRMDDKILSTNEKEIRFVHKWMRTPWLRMKWRTEPYEFGVSGTT